jgi:hypothetical protein
MAANTDMKPTPRAVEQADALMMGFAERTGLTSDRPIRRYLWTDAFAVCNFLGLARATDERRYTDLALRLVDQVHHVLGSFRGDDSRTGWISGLGKQEGEQHPTQGGLRIGKELAERAPSEPFDEDLEWSRDGQYFHYLTKWMHALDQVYQSTGITRFHAWARELAKAAHDAFVYGGRRHRRMVWKMSTDLSRPLVRSMGHHDPLDGFITCAQLRSTDFADSNRSDGPSLDAEMADFATMLAGQNWATADPLGLGGLLTDASRVVQLMHLGAFETSDLLEGLLAAALRGLAAYARHGELSRPASERLAFRELGLAIGLCAIPMIEDRASTARLRFSRTAEILDEIRALRSYASLGFEIQSCWLTPQNRETRVWFDHRDISDVMLATTLVPAGFLYMPLAVTN